jgi:hypothetical protein
VGIAREKDMDLEFTLAVFCCKTANQASSSLYLYLKFGWKIRSQPYVSIHPTTKNHSFSPPTSPSNQADVLIPYLHALISRINTSGMPNRACMRPRGGAVRPSVRPQYVATIRGVHELSLVFVQMETDTDPDHNTCND